MKKLIIEIKNYLEAVRLRKAYELSCRKDELSKKKYNVKESSGHLWITIDGELAIPDDCLKRSVLDVLQDLRIEYMKR